MTCQLSRTNLRLFLVVIEFSCSYRLLKESKVAVLSSRWLGPFNAADGGGDHWDGDGFHLKALHAGLVDHRAPRLPALLSS